METFELSATDRAILLDLTAELRRFNRTRESADTLMTVQQAADYLGVSRQTITRRLGHKELTKVSRGGCLGILKSELDAIKPS